jgi:Cytochrome c
MAKYANMHRSGLRRRLENPMAHAAGGRGLFFLDLKTKVKPGENHDDIEPRMDSCTGRVAADDRHRGERENDAVAQGRQLYLEYCGSCHGLTGEGDGPVAPALTTPPANLRRLSDRFGSPLPRTRSRASSTGVPRSRLTVRVICRCGASVSTPQRATSARCGR